MIYIYADNGVAADCLYHTYRAFQGCCENIGVITAKDVATGTFMSDASVFILPGGADLPYLYKLFGKANQNIKTFVEKGGSFLGICAGAYYASAHIQFHKGMTSEITGNRPLAFFEGKAIGPLLGPYEKNANKSFRACIVRTCFPDLPMMHMYYNGGCFFQDVPESVDIWAEYDRNHPAILSIAYGKGRVVLSGVHFEYDPFLLNDRDPLLAPVIRCLKKAEEKRQVLLKKIYTQLVCAKIC